LRHGEGMGEDKGKFRKFLYILDILNFTVKLTQAYVFGMGNITRYL